MFPRFNREANNAGAFRPLRCLLLTFSLFALLFALPNLVFEKGIATDLYSLAGDDGQLIGALAQKTANEIRVLCADEERAAKCRAVFPFRESPDPAQLLDFFRAHGSGLLSEKTRALLAAGDYERIRRSVKRRDYTGVGLFPKSADPFYFLSDYVASLKSLMPKGLSDGQVLLTANAKCNEKKLADLIALAENDDGIFLSGAPFHTFLAAEISKIEINILGGVSLVAILLIGLALFRSPRFILPTLSTLLCGFLVGATAVFAFFPKPHILTFLFGSTLIGLGVDYCYHSLAKNGERRKFTQNLTAALATTTLAFAPLLFSSVAVLNQMATFTIAGLVTIWGFAIANAKHVPTRCHNLLQPDIRRWKFTPIVLFVTYLAMLVAFAAGWQRLSTTNDPASFYKPPKLLARGEAKVAEIIGGVSTFAVVSAPTLEEALAKEEATGINGVSRIIPSIKRQQQNLDLIRRFCSADENPPPHEPQFVTLESLPPSLRTLADAMILEHDGMTHLIAPIDKNADKTIPVVSPRSELERMFARFTAETVILVVISFAAMAIMLLAIYRRRFMEYLTPVTMALLFTAGALGWLGEKITFFHILCFFVMTGLGIDYVIFNTASRQSTKLADTMDRRGIVLASFLTSLVGFGTLGFTSFPPTRAMGLTLAIGLFFCYIFSLEWKSHDTKTAAKPSDWSKQKEKGATRLGMLIIWHIYRLFGKTVAKIVFLVPLAFIAPFCRGVGWRKILAFAWSRIDIVDAVTLRKNTPTFTFSGDGGWRDGGAFLISSHLGSIEVLAALCDESKPHLHAFQQMTHDPIFTTFLTERMNGFTLHAVEDIGVETAVEMQDAIQSGSLVLMAGDRLSAGNATTREQARGHNPKHSFLGKDLEWPKGVFRFAKLMESPIYAVIAVKTGWNAYEIKSCRLGDDILHDYVTFLETEVRRHPEQWFQF